MKRVITYILIAFTLTACLEKPVYPETEQEPVLTVVKIDIAAADVMTKANLPLIPDVENLIYDIWVIQFSERGVLYTGVDKLYRTNGEDGARFLTLEAQVMSGKSTICLLANLNKMNTLKLNDGSYKEKEFCNVSALRESLPDNLFQFKNTLLDLGTFLHYVNTNSKPVAIPMFGYWEGTIGSGDPTLGGNNLNVTLGRMVCRVNLTIDNKTAETITELKFTNASNKAYYFPQISSPALPVDSYCTNKDANTFARTVESGKSSTIYFYWGPNFCYGPDQATRITFTDAAGKTYTTMLTNSAPTDHNIDYNLYYNCNYTITATIQ